MNIRKIYAAARANIERKSGVQALFWIDPDINKFCREECFRLAEQSTRKPKSLLGLAKPLQWQKQCAEVCLVEFHECLARLKAQRLAASESV